MGTSKLIFITSLIFLFIIISLQYLTQLKFHYSTNSNPNHLIVIQHGLNYPSLLNYPTYYFIKQTLSSNKHNSTDEYMIYLANSNSSPYILSFLYHTNNGIIHAATNLANEIYDIIISNPSINKLSLIGGSLGGNYIRYTSYLLHCVYISQC